ncbi:MAG: LemA family protein [Gammaproteobacteria bacterium]|nr:LemA family protein [Gammaproteobacteria bacterium]
MLGFFVTLVLVVALPVVLALAVVFRTYNSLRGVYEETKSCLSIIQGFSSKRSSVLADIRTVVSNYATHERSVHMDVARFENQLSQEGTVPSVALGALARAYPELKSDSMFLDNQQKLEALAEELRVSQARYDDRVRVFNIQRNSIPTRLYAPFLGFTKDLPYSAEIVGKDDGIQILDRVYDEEKLGELRAKGAELLSQSREAIARQGARLKEGTKDGAGALKGLVSAKNERDMIEVEGEDSGDENTAKAEKPTSAN